MEFKRDRVIALHLEGNSPPKIVRQLEHLQVNRMFVHRTINRYNDTGSTAKRHGGGHKRTATSKEMIDKAKALLEGNPNLSARKIAAKLNISTERTQRILKDHLGLKAHRNQEIVQDPTLNQEGMQSVQNDEQSSEKNALVEIDPGP